MTSGGQVRSALAGGGDAAHDCFFADGARRDALERIHGAIDAGAERILVLGDKGLGKTILLCRLANELKAVGIFSLLLPMGVFSCTANSRFEQIVAAHRLGIGGTEGAGDDAAGLREVADIVSFAVALRRSRQSRTRPVWLLDDVDLLDPLVLDRLDQWTKLHGDSGGAPTIVMAGLPDLLEKLANRPDPGESMMERLAAKNRAATAGRETLTIELAPFARADLSGLIQHRLSLASEHVGELFPPVAIDRLFACSQGHPETAIRIAGNALDLATSRSAPSVAVDLIDEAVLALGMTLPLPLASEPRGLFRDRRSKHRSDDENAPGEAEGPLQPRTGAGRIRSVFAVACSLVVAAGVGGYLLVSADPKDGPQPERASPEATGPAPTGPSTAVSGGPPAAPGDPTPAVAIGEMSTEAGFARPMAPASGQSPKLPFATALVEPMGGPGLVGERTGSTEPRSSYDVDLALSGSRPPSANPPSQASTPSGPVSAEPTPVAAATQTAPPIEAVASTPPVAPAEDVPPAATTVAKVDGAPQVLVVPVAPAAAPMAAAGAVPAADTAFAQAVPPAEAAPLDLARLIERGRAFVDQGDIVSARLLFDLAARRGSAEAARLMGETYDPLLSTGTPVGASKPDYQRAVTWYRRAVEMGDGDAKRRIGALIQHVERAAAQGDEDARQTLQTLR